MTVDLQDELTARIGELLADELVILAEAEDRSEERPCRERV